MISLPKCSIGKGRTGYPVFFSTYFSPGGPGDISAHPDLPGIAQNGQPEWGQYKGQVVPGSYLQNNLFGSTLGAAGYTLNPTQALQSWQNAPASGSSALQFLHPSNNDSFPTRFLPSDPTDQWGVVVDIRIIPKASPGQVERTWG